MKKINLLLAFFTFCSIWAFAQPSLRTANISRAAKLPPSKVDFDGYEKLAKEVKEYRKTRLVSLDTFNAYAKDQKTIILDTRSAEMFKRKHLKGAVNLNFSDFTLGNLNALIPDANTRILIYCNNNFDNEPLLFASKAARPVKYLSKGRWKEKEGLSLALNIPTFINLYGYGYKNVYELAELVSVFNLNAVFEGTDVLTIVSR